jgi:hypothetical protein
MTAEPIPWAMARSLVERGVPVDFLPAMTALHVVRGHIVFHEPVDDDLVVWEPETGAVTTFYRRAFALGASDNLTASAGALHHLRIHADPLGWLRERGRGLVIVDWRQCFDRLRNVPRVAVDEAVLRRYREAMRPALPEVSVVLLGERRAAA